MKDMWIRLCAMALGAFLSASAWAADEKVTIIVFPSALATPMYVAADAAIFEKHGLDAEVVPTSSSEQVLKGLVLGEYQIANAAMDNYIAYQEGQKDLGLDQQADLVAFLSGATGNLSLIATDEIKSYTDLKGKTVGVDSPNTAFAFVLYKMLENNGLSRDDYNVEAVGGTSERFDAMKEDKIAASIMTPGWTERAAQFGGHELDTSLNAIGPYQTITYAATREWLDTHRDEAVAFVESYLEAAEWATDPANEDEVVKILQERLEGMSEQAARGGIVGLRKTIAADGTFDEAALRTVVELREQYGEPPKELGDPEQYVDMSILQEARRD